MTQNYAQSRIRNALKENPDSPAKARQTVMRWALEDPKLMAELVAPHLAGIVSYAISRVEGHGSEPETLASAVKGAKKSKETSFGLELLKHVADDHAVVFGQESGLIPGKKAPASQGHIDAIKMMADKGKTKAKTKK